MKKSGRPHWLGPGRVVFHEILPHQQEGDERKHIGWVLIGTQLLRCSVHSVRPVTESKRFQHETGQSEDTQKWKTLADILLKKEYVDMVGDEPSPDELELPDLPLQPDQTTVSTTSRRITKKSPPTSSTTTTGPSATETDQGMTGDRATSSTTRVMEEVNEYEPEPKKLRSEEPGWVEQL